MNQPYIPPQSQPAAGPPPLPLPQQQQAQQPTELMVKELIPGRVHLDGHVLDPAWTDHINWAYNTLMGKMNNDRKALYDWLKTATTVPLFSAQEELPQQPAQPAAAPQPPQQPTGQQSMSMQPPPNPISDQTAPQQAEPPDPTPPTAGSAEPKETEAPDEAAWDRISGQQCKNIRGLKSRLTRTHKVDWADYCARFHLDQKTGLPLNEQEQVQPAGLAAQPNRPPPSSPGMPTQQTADGHAAAVPPPAPPQSQQPAHPAKEQPPTAQADSKLPQSVPQGMEPQMDYWHACLQMLPMAVKWDGGRAVTAEEAEWVADWLRGAFNGNIRNLTDDTFKWTLYKWLYWLAENRDHYTMPVREPEQQTHPTAPAMQAGQPPQPPAQQADEVPTFAPPSSPPAQQTAQPPQSGDTESNMAMDLVMAAAGGSLGPEAQALAGQALQPAQTDVSRNRRDFAQTLGGEIDVYIVSVLDSASVDLSDRVDANQLVGVAEAHALKEVVDPERLKFREDRKVAQRIFGDMLSKTPKVYVLTNGFNWLLDEHYIGILMRRVVSGTIMRQGKAIEFKL